MTTERNELTGPTTVQDIPVDLSVPFDDVTAPPEPDIANVPEPAIEEPVTEEPDTNVGGAGIDNVSIGNESQKQSSVYETEEFKSFQSATDKRIAEMEKQLAASKAAEAERAEAESLKTLDAEVRQYADQLYSEFISQGFDDVTARQYADRQTASAKREYLATLKANKLERQLSNTNKEFQNRIMLTRQYELASQYGIPFESLNGSSSPEEMEIRAKYEKKINDLAGRLERAIPGQSYGSSVPSSDVAPTNAESVLDRYNAGDSAITEDMARAAAKQMGLSIFN